MSNPAPVRPNLARLINARFANPEEAPDNHAHRSALAHMGHAITRQLYDVGRGTSPALRLSAAGRCARATSYAIHGTPKDGRQLTGRSKITFALGDVVELLVVHALREALPDHDGGRWGLRNISEQQQTVFLDVPGVKCDPIPGHPDGMLTVDGKPWGVLEVKSTSSYGFQRAAKILREGGEPWDRDEGYWHQLQAYLAALDLDVGAVVMVSKDSGAVCSFYVRRDPYFLEDYAAHLRLAHKPPQAVPRMLPGGGMLEPRVALHKTRGTPTAKHGSLPFQCVYCSWYRPCWKSEGLVETVKRDYRGAPALGLFVNRPDLEVGE